MVYTLFLNHDNENDDDNDKKSTNRIINDFRLEFVTLFNYGLFKKQQHKTKYNKKNNTQ